MAYTANIPYANDNISTSQSQIRANFQFLGDTTGNGTDGYYRLPNGLIMQWGLKINYTDDTTITFPVAFVSAPYNIQLTIRKNSGSAEDFAYVKNAATTTNTQFVARAVGDNLPFDLFWFAIGV